MKIAANLVLLVAILQVELIESIEQSEEIINKVNSLQTTWKAGINMYLGAPLTDSRLLLGTDLELDRHLIPIKKHAIEKDEIPERFDSREQWPECSSMNDIHNQGRCGVCWATATAGVLSDRECIHSKNHDLFRYSAENLATCGKQGEVSCNGGFPSKAISYWIQNGLVSGGRYKVHEGCQPFSDKLNAGEHIECRHECTNLEYPISYEKDLRDGSTVYALEERNPIQMQKEIMTNGPVVVSFTVYQDFNYYKSGVYQHVTGDYSGRHAVKLFGWGVENGLPYWILANSWGEQWGENGFFKILRGNDECGIESVVDAGLP